MMRRNNATLVLYLLLAGFSLLLPLAVSFCSLSKVLASTDNQGYYYFRSLSSFLGQQSSMAARSQMMISANEVSLQLDAFELTTSHIRAEDIDLAYVIESSSYPADEAASHKALCFRQENAGDYFMGLYTKDTKKLIGFACGTLCDGESLVEETMAKHKPSGQTLCIHSVVITEEERRKGYASLLLKAYVKDIADRCQNVKLALLISKAHLLGFYTQCGFDMVGLSSVVHGEDPWFEMRLPMEKARSLPFVQVSAFTDQPFAGNPAAVFFEHGNPVWMQQVAAELKLSETSFVEKMGGRGRGRYGLRWFTPTAEVDLCGHATLAAAHALWETGRVPGSEEIVFSTLSGDLTCKPIGEGWVEMDFPAEPAAAAPAPGGLLAGLGLGEGAVLFCGRNRLDYLVEVSFDSFISMEIDMESLRQIETRGILVTCQAPSADLGNSEKKAKSVPASATAGGADFLSRCFFPRVGVDEDPVTGSAHCALGPYWAAKLGEDCQSVTGYQWSERGGIVKIQIGSGEKSGRVQLQGKARTGFSGYFRR